MYEYLSAVVLLSPSTEKLYEKLYHRFCQVAQLVTIFNLPSYDYKSF